LCPCSHKELPALEDLGALEGATAGDEDEPDRREELPASVADEDDSE